MSTRSTWCSSLSSVCNSASLWRPPSSPLLSNWETRLLWPWTFFSSLTYLYYPQFVQDFLFCTKLAPRSFYGLPLTVVLWQVCFTLKRIRQGRNGNLYLNWRCWLYRQCTADLLTGKWRMLTVHNGLEWSASLLSHRRCCLGYDVSPNEGDSPLPRGIIASSSLYKWHTMKR